MTRIAIAVMIAACAVSCSSCRNKKGSGKEAGEKAPVAQPVVGCEGKGCQNVSEELKRDPSVPMLSERCKSGSAVHCEMLGDKQGDDVEKANASYLEARTKYEISCEAGQPLDCKRLSLMWHEGKGVAKDEDAAKKSMKEALSIYRKACEADAHLDCCLAADIYGANEVLKPDKGMAKTYADRGLDGARGGCDSGKAQGCFTLAEMHRQGLCGLKKDEGKATEIMEKGTALLKEE